MRRALAEGAGANLTASLDGLTAETLSSQYQVTLRPFLTDSDARVRCATVEVLGKVLQAAIQVQSQPGAVPVDARGVAPFVESLQGDVLARLSDADVVVRTAAADVAADTGLQQAVPTIVETLGKMQSSKDGEAMASLAEALGRLRDMRALPLLERLSSDGDSAVARAAARAVGDITGKPVQTARRAPRPPAVPAEGLALVDRAVADPAHPLRAVIHTRFGGMTLRLYAMEAPLTVYSFVKLARSGYFDGLTFHRVVPNFVVQGGDPRGDGWGGPGYTIRCEYNPIWYGRGTVGMALAGKDTGGSQFFITHSPQPRLNGRYTVFAQVVSGVDVLDRLTEGDVMRVEVLER